jgi:pimeloyl-ACP methyl ester carboxylesterase
MNRFEHYRVEIDGIPIHYVHERGRGPAPQPLILSHGWPWTFWDWKDVIPRLADPAAFGGRAEDAFDVIVPSLPGFAFSAPLRTTGVDAGRSAQLWLRLMRDVLGHERFGAAGGDWGAAVTGELALLCPEVLTGIFLTLPWLPGIDGRFLRADAFAPDEQWMVARRDEAQPLMVSHMTVHMHDPQTLAYALADSPLGLAAWMWECRRAWSDCDGDVERVFSFDFLCTTASLYWLTDTIGSSLRIYKEFSNASAALAQRGVPHLDVPTGLAIAPKDLLFLPRRLAEKHCNLRRWTVLPRGGHFAPAEQPEAVANEIRAFFRSLGA